MKTPTDDRTTGAAPAAPPAPAAPAPEKPYTFVIAAACFMFGITLGWTISSLLSPRPHMPSEPDIERLCSTEPGVRVRAWTHIVLHHSDGAVGDAAMIDRYHRRTKRWKNGLGYDFVIGNGTRSGDGEIEVGHRWRRQLNGAHCKAGGMNEKAIGICFVGDFETSPGPSAAQLLAGITLVRHLAAKFSIPPANILGHGQVEGADTLCPGKHFPIKLFSAAAHP
ncbi:MAG: peptidoglycan recognition family protein [Planctomycetota bacterium]